MTSLSIKSEQISWPIDRSLLIPLSTMSDRPMQLGYSAIAIHSKPNLDLLKGWNLEYPSQLCLSLSLERGEE